jgi:hypothetical protein
LPKKCGPYFLREARLDAFSGLTRTLTSFNSGLAWVAKLHNPNRHLAAGLQIRPAESVAVFLGYPVAAFTLFNDGLKRLSGIFCCFTGLHNANLLKKYHFSLESEKKLPYNTLNYFPAFLLQKENSLYK